MNLAEIVKSGQLDEFQPRPHPLAAVASDDREFCERSACPKCGRYGREYRPFVRHLGRAARGGIINYIFYAVCSTAACQHAEEL